MITDKRFCLITTMGYTIWLNEEDADYIMEHWIKGTEVIVWDKKNKKGIARKEIKLMTPAGEIEDQEKERKGYWKCSYGHWHPKGEECGHGELEKYNQLN